MRSVVHIVICLRILGVSFVCIGQSDRAMEREKASSEPQTRLSLVIGNGRYTKASAFNYPVNDANDLAATLQEPGFEVTKGTGTNLVQMRSLIHEFGEKLDRKKGFGLFYFAGHGVEVRGWNFPITINADIAHEAETADYALNLRAVLRQIDVANTGLNIVYRTRVGTSRSHADGIEAATRVI